MNKSEVPQKYTETLGEQLAVKFYLLEQDLYRLRLDWRTYRGLFGTNPERVALLNSISGSFTATIERALFESVLLALRRFVDKGGKKGNRKPLSLEMLRKIAPPEKLAEINCLINTAVEKAEFAKHWSDKRLAHSDIEYRLGEIELKKASRQKVTAAIDAIAAVIKWIGANLLDTHLVTHPIGDLKDESYVLKHLYEGKAVFDEKPALVAQLLKDEKYSQADDVYEFPEWLSRRPDELD